MKNVPRSSSPNMPYGTVSPVRSEIKTPFVRVGITMAMDPPRECRILALIQLPRRHQPHV